MIDLPLLRALAEGDPRARVPQQLGQPLGRRHRLPVDLGVDAEQIPAGHQGHPADAAGHDDRAVAAAPLEILEEVGGVDPGGGHLAVDRPAAPEHGEGLGEPGRLQPIAGDAAVACPHQGHGGGLAHHAVLLVDPDRVDELLTDDDRGSTQLGPGEDDQRVRQAGDQDVEMDDAR